MPQTYYDSELTGEQIESALEAIDGVVTPSNNGKILRVKDGNIEAVSASEYTSGIDVEPLSVTVNDTYTAPAGKAYSPVTVNVSGGGGGGDLPSGGSDGDVLIKSGTGAAWTNMPQLLGNFANLELTNTASRYYATNEYLMYNGKLYQTKVNISQGSTLNPGDNGNLLETKVSDVFQVLKCTVRIAISAIPANGTKNNGVSIATPPSGYSFLFIIPQYSDNGYPVVSTWISDPWRANAAIYNPTSAVKDDVATVNLFFIRGIVTTQQY